MKVDTILYPTDFSDFAESGLHFASAIARDTGAKLLIVHVEEPFESYAGGQFYGPSDDLRENLKALLSNIVPTKPEVAYEQRYEIGDPAEVITRLVREENVDLLVVGTHGRSGLSRLLMGSTAEKLVRAAPCPVLTFKPAKREE